MKNHDYKHKEKHSSYDMASLYNNLIVPVVLLVVRNQNTGSDNH